MGAERNHYHPPMDITAVRPASFGDVPQLVAVSNAADLGWWGQGETDSDDIEQRLRLAGDLDQQSRVVETEDGPVAFAIRFAPHDTALAIDPHLPSVVRRPVEDRLLGWVADTDARRLDAPAQDAALLAADARHGFRAASSSFELERSPKLPLPSPAFPSGVEVRPFDRDAHARSPPELYYVETGRIYLKTDRLKGSRINTDFAGVREETCRPLHG
jgi:hypothetical protein